VTPPSQWSGHVIVCGLHGVGLRTVEQLHLAGVQVVVVDEAPDARLVRALDSWGVPHLLGSARLTETLLAAGLAGAVAVVCVESDDLVTLETALLVRELRADLRVVVQLANASVGRAMEGVIGAGAVLDVAALAAPSVVEACLGDPVHELTVAGISLHAVQVRALKAGTLRQLFGDLTPLAVLPGDGVPALLCPGRDQPVRRGDMVTLLGTGTELDDAGIAWRAARDAAERRAQRAAQRRDQRAEGLDAVRPGRSWSPGMRPPRAGQGMTRYLARTLLAALDRRLQAALAVMLVLVAASTTVLHLGYRESSGRGMSWLDGLYFTVETVATVGYGDFSFREQPAWLRVYAITLMIVGATLVTIFFVLLTNVLVSRRIEEQLGRRRVPGMAGHVVLVGVGEVGVRVVEGLLRRGRQVVVIDFDESNRFLAQVRALGVPVVIGDATLADTLDAANVPAAGAVAVLTSNDLTNLETGLAVLDRLGERRTVVPTVVRLFDRQLASTVERNFAFTHVRSTAALAAPWFAGAALGLDVLSSFYVADSPLLLGRLPVSPGSPLVGLAMQDLGASIRVVGIARAADGGRLEHPPRRATRLEAGDDAYLVGPYDELLRVLRRDVSANGVPAG